MKKHLLFFVLASLFLIHNIYAQRPMYNLRLTKSERHISGQPCLQPFVTSVYLKSDFSVGFGQNTSVAMGGTYSSYDDMPGGFSIDNDIMTLTTRGATYLSGGVICDRYSGGIEVRRDFQIGPVYKYLSYFSNSYRVGDYTTRLNLQAQPSVWCILTYWPANLSINNPVNNSTHKLFADTQFTISATDGFPFDAYTWKYQIGSGAEQSYLPGSGKSSVSFSGNDLLGSNFEALANGLNKVYFKLYYRRADGTSQSTDRIIFNLTLRAPQINSVIPQMALCNESTTSTALIKFDKKIGSNRKLQIIYSKVDVSSNTPIEVRDSDLNANNEYVLQNVPVNGNFQVWINSYLNDNNTQVVNHEVNTTPFTFTTNLFPLKLESTLESSGIYCFNGKDGILTARARGGTYPYTYIYNKDGNAFLTKTLSSTNTAYWVYDDDVKNLEPGNYSLTMTDKNGCRVQPDKTVLLRRPSTAYTLESKSTKDATGYGLSTGVVELKTTGGTIATTSFMYNGYVAPQLKDSTGKAYSATFVSRVNDVVTYRYSNLPATKYTIRGEDMGINGRVGKVRDSVGCLVKDTVRVNQPPRIILKLTEKQGIVCYGENTGSISANAKGGVPITGGSYPYQYVWAFSKDGLETFIDLPANDSTINQKIAGYYRLTVTDKNGISKSDVYFLKQPAKIDYQVTVKNVTCLNWTDGEARVSTIQGGFKPYTVNWSEGGASAQITGLSAGTFTVNVSDSVNCKVASSFRVKDTLNGIEVKLKELRKPTCYGDCDAKLDVGLLVESPPYTMQWTNGSTDSSLSNLCAGDYKLQVVNNKNCLKELVVTVPQTEPLQLSVEPEVYLCIGQTAELNIGVSDSNYTYQWSGNSFNSDKAKVSLTEPGVFSAKVSNSKGCSNQKYVNIYKVNSSIKSDFVVPTQVFAGEEISIVNITQAGFADTSYWQVPSAVKVKSLSFEYANVVFPDTGIYQIGLRSTQDKCVKLHTKDVRVLKSSFDQKSYNSARSFVEEYEIMPNPNGGTFQVRIKLQETAAVKLKFMDFYSKGVIAEEEGYDKDEYLIPMDVKVAASTYILLLETPYGSRVLKVVIL